MSGFLHAQSRRLCRWLHLYHAIDELGKPHLKWLDLHALASSLCGTNESLQGVFYFTAHATWLPKSVGRHIEYIAALRHVGVRCVVGHFKEKKRQCNACKAQWIGHEEKETDVAMAVQIVADAFRNEFDRALVISADSDLGPSIKMVKKHFPEKAVNVIAPPGRFGHARDLKPILQLTSGKLAKCLLPEHADRTDGSRIFQRPSAYAP
jgi:hypothetical protein